MKFYGNWHQAVSPNGVYWSVVVVHGNEHVRSYLNYRGYELHKVYWAIARLISEQKRTFRVLAFRSQVRKFNEMADAVIDEQFASESVASEFAAMILKEVALGHALTPSPYRGYRGTRPVWQSADGPMEVVPGTTILGWRQDPSVATRLRYWDGHDWTGHISEPLL